MQHSEFDSVRVITFDMYGTLLDLKATFAPAFRNFFCAKGYFGDAEGIVEAWERNYLHESIVDTLLGGARTPFERVRRVILSQLFAKLKIPHTTDEIDALIDQATIRLFPDVIESLNHLRGRYRLVVLSNGDLASLEGVVNLLSIPVERTISAEQVGYYKPHHEVYRHCARQLGLDSNQILHVATHGWDVRGAKAVGMQGAYIDRYCMPYGFPSAAGGPASADLEASDLIEFASKIV